MPTKSRSPKKSTPRMFGGEVVVPGNIIVRQRGTQWHPGQKVELEPPANGKVTYLERKGRIYVELTPTESE